MVNHIPDKLDPRLEALYLQIVELESQHPDPRTGVFFGGLYPYLIGNQNLQNLEKARFMAGFRAQLGLPPGYPPTQVPDLVVLGSDTAAVTFNMLCSQFEMVELIPAGGYNPPTWTNTSQPAGAAWIFQSKVDLRLSVVDKSAYSSLPAAVQAQIQNLGGDAFSVQQLLFDLANAGLSSQIPIIQGIKPGTKLYMLLQQYFIGAYFTEMQKGGQPLLGAAVTHSDISLSTLALTNLNFEVSPLVGDNGQAIARPTADQQGLATLSYLCEANGHAPLPAVAFNWNWIDANEASDYDGVVAINRKTFTDYFSHQLHSYVVANCWKSWVRVWLTGVFDTNVHFQWSMTGGQTPTVTTGTGANVLSYSFTSAASDSAGLGGDMGAMDLNTSFNLDVSFAGNAITIKQHLVIYLMGRGLFGISSSGNIVDKTITDTYTMAITGEGKLKATLNSVPEDHSVDLSQGGFVNFWSGDINSMTNQITSWVRGFTSTNFEDIPVSVAQSFVFPGGKTFAFKSATFSDNQDLVSHITYTDPS